VRIRTGGMPCRCHGSCGCRRYSACRCGSRAFAVGFLSQFGMRRSWPHDRSVRPWNTAEESMCWPAKPPVRRLDQPARAASRSGSKPTTNTSPLRASGRRISRGSLAIRSMSRSSGRRPRRWAISLAPGLRHEKRPSAVTSCARSPSSALSSGFAKISLNSASTPACERKSLALRQVVHFGHQ